MKKHDRKRRFHWRPSPEGDAAAGREQENWDAEGYALVDDSPAGGASWTGAAENAATRYRTVRRAAREVGLPERTIREWILMGYLGVAPNISAGYSPFLVNVNELRKVAAQLLGSS